MQKKIAVLGGADFSEPGSRTPDNFTVVVPEEAVLNVRALWKLLTGIEKATKKPLEDPNHRQLRDVCAGCVQQGDQASVLVVAYREIGPGSMAYKVVCSCSGIDKLCTVSGEFLMTTAGDAFVVSFPKTPQEPSRLRGKNPTVRVRAFGSATAATA